MSSSIIISIIASSGLCPLISAASATVYNTVHAFKKKGYLKEIPINSDQSYFDTNTSHHHHFYDENQKDLIDIDDADVEPVKINTRIPGKKIKSVEVLVKVEDAE